jgi:hypothetical protein
MIKIVSGFSFPSGSTVALVNLGNQFNERGHECVFYGPNKWHRDKCKAADIAEFHPEEGDIIIVHHIKLFSSADLFKIRDKVGQLRKKTRLDALRDIIQKNTPGSPKIAGLKIILTCQENGLFPLKRLKYSLFDKIHYADFSLAKYHKITHSHFICPNFGNRLTPSKTKPEKVAGIIGSIRRENQIESAVEKSFSDGMKTVILYGHMSDPVYYYSTIRPLTQKYPGRIKYAGFMDDKQQMYDSISDVYRSVARPWSLVRRECTLTNTMYHGPEACQGESLADDQIFTVWKNELGL